MTREEREYIEDAVDAAPDLSPEQIEEMALLFAAAVEEAGRDS